MSIRPGRSVIPGNCIVVASGGALTSASDPTAAILLLVTSTTHPSCTFPSSASKTRAGTSNCGFLPVPFAGDSAGSAPASFEPDSAQRTRVSEGVSGGHPSLRRGGNGVMLPQPCLACEHWSSAAQIQFQI